MGIIQKQAFRSTVVNFIGAGFGAISRLSMPVILSEFQIGFLALLDAVSGMLVALFSMGYHQLLYRLFPEFRDEGKGHHGFLALGLFLSLIGISLSFIVYVTFKDYFIPNSDDYSAYAVYLWMIIPIVAFRTLFRNMDGYVGMLMNTVFGSFLDGLVSKVLLLLGLVGFALSFYSYDSLITIFTIALCAPGALITLYALLKTKKIVLPSKEFIVPERKKKVMSYIGFGMLLGASGSIIYYIDSLMINKLISVEALGIYSVFFFAAKLITIPSRSLMKISVIMISESWKEGNMDNILDIYKKSCLNQLLIAAFIFSIGWIALDPALNYLQAEKVPFYKANQFVFFFLGISMLIELGTGENASIISASDKYKFNTYFNLIFAGLLIITNLIFIHYLDIIGAALASAVAMLIANFLRWIFLKKVYGLQPFDGKFLKVFIFGAVLIAIASFARFDLNPVVQIITGVAIICITFFVGLYAFKLSPDLTDMMKGIAKKAKRMVKGDK
jgi:O-antigen/teichoic acid export membrane protein